MSEPVQKFGWIPFAKRTAKQHAAHEAAVAEMPRFEITGVQRYGDADKVMLTELWKHPAVVEALGHPYPGTHQLTGSCVGAGGGNALATIIFADAVLRNEPEQIVIPFWLLPYGRSRFYLGDRSPGEGSQGSTFAKAVREDGTLDARMTGLPSFVNEDGLVWGEDTEYSWSDGDASQTMDLLPQSKKHLVKTTAECRSANDVREAIKNGYPVTIASTWGGQMQCRTQGDPPVLLNDRSGTWNHQMSVHNWWNHPSLNEIFWIQNQWGDAHGSDPAGGPLGGFWVAAEHIDWICNSGEVYAFSQWDGFPAQDIPWYWENDWFVQHGPDRTSGLT
jgi:hypothetical protein